MTTYVTTSWDDGHRLDTRLGKLLDTYGLKGTFYISKDYIPDRLSEEEIRTLGESHEIGAHTVTHPDMTKIAADEAVREAKESRTWLESVTGAPVSLFCYPFGKHTEETAALMKDAGFAGARTTELFVRETPDPFRMGTTLNVYPFPFRKTDAKNHNWRHLLQPLQQKYAKARQFGVPLSAMGSWGSLARASLQAVQARGGVFHLWGHSWEIEKYGMWEELEDFFRYLRDTDCTPVTNSGALHLS